MKFRGLLLLIILFPYTSRCQVATPHQYDQANSNELDITVEDTVSGLFDLTVIAFNLGSTDSFNEQFDANKSAGELNRPTLYTVCFGAWMSIYVLHSVSTTSTVDMGLEPGQTSIFVLTFNGVNTFDPTTYLYLEDLQQDSLMHNIRSGPYTFSADSAEAWGRFIVHFTPPAIINSTDASCDSQGTISIQQPGTANWNYTIQLDSSTIIASGVLNQNSPININAGVGDYTLTLVDSNNYTVTKNIQINGVDGITAAFNTPADTVQPLQTDTFNSTTANALSYNWNLGNGTTDSGQTVTTSYTDTGTYNVILTVTNADSCSSSAMKTIIVSQAAVTGLPNITDDNNIRIWSHDDEVYVAFNGPQRADAIITLFNIVGQQISSEKYTGASVYRKELTNINEGYIIVRVAQEGKVTNAKVLISDTR